MGLRIIILSCLLFMMAGCWTDDPTRHNTFIPITSIEVTATYESMADQTVNQYRASADFSGVYTEDITSKVLWRIDNKKIAAVSNDTGSEGLVTAFSPGETSVTAMYEDFSESAPVVVTDAFLTGIEITPQDAESQVGGPQQYAASGIFSDDSSQVITTLAAWQSSDTDVATIDNAGLATTLNIGTTTISVAWQGIESSTSLLVADATLTAITISPEEATIAQGTTTQFKADGTKSDGTIVDITDTVDWQSDDTGVGDVNAEGLATGIGPGETEISASFEVEGATISATAALTVTSAVIVSISITPENSTIEADESQQFTATGTFSDGSDQDITDLVNWFTTNNSVGTISNSPNNHGSFVSIDPGTTIIEATFGGVSRETRLTVQ